MLTAVKGIVRGNTIVVENEDLHDYNGFDAIVTFLKKPQKKIQEKLDWDSFVIPSERGKNVESYMNEMRVNDRI